jgi:serine/threonine protein kinase
MPQWSAFLREKLLDALEDKNAEPSGAITVKSNRARTVFYFPPEMTGCAGLYLKKYNVRTSVEALQNAVVPNKPQREWKCIRVFSGRGVRVAEPAFLGVPRTLATRRPSYLGVVEIPKTRFPNEALEDGSTDRERFISELARWTRTVLDAGVVHRDFQPGNILIQTETDGWKFHLIDLHAARPGTQTPGRAIRALGKLLGDLAPWVDSAERLKFLEAYSGSRRGAVELEPLVDAEILRQKRRVLRKRTERALVDSSAFAVQWVGTWKIYRRRDVPLQDIFRVVEKGADVLRSDETQAKVHVKKIGGMGFLRNLRDLFQMPRGRRAFMAFQGFRVRGLPAPDAYALAESRPSGLLRESYLLTRRLDGVMNLQSAIHEYLIAPRFENRKASDISKKMLAGAVARAVAMIHTAGVLHRDLKGENVLIRGVGERFEVYFVDLDSVRFADSIGIERAAKNLAQLGASVPYCVNKREFIRFFAVYAKHSPFYSRRRELLKMSKRIMEKRIAGWLALYRRERNIAEGRAAS